VGRVAESIDERLAEWLVAQPVFFVATAPLAREGRVNCSPKGNRGELSVPDPTTIAYLDQTGSGVETISHLQENGRIVVMWAAFDGPPRIVRAHGTGRIVRIDDAEFATLAPMFPAMATVDTTPRDPTGQPGPPVGARCVVVVHVERVSDSCGYGVPLLTFAGHRPTMDQWAERKGRSGIAAYQEEHNARSIDGLPGLASRSPE